MYDSESMEFMTYMDIEIPFLNHIIKFVKYIQCFKISRMFSQVVQMTWYLEHGEKGMIFPTQDVFCNIIGLVCRMVTIFTDAKS